MLKGQTVYVVNRGSDHEGESILAVRSTLRKARIVVRDFHGLKGKETYEKQTLRRRESADHYIVEEYRDGYDYLVIHRFRLR